MLPKSFSLSLLLLLPLTLAAQRVEYHHFGTVYPVDGSAQGHLFQELEDGIRPLPTGGEIKIIDEGEGIDLSKFYPLAVYPIKESVKQPVPFEGPPERVRVFAEQFYGFVRDASLTLTGTYGNDSFEGVAGLILWVKGDELLSIHSVGVYPSLEEYVRNNVEIMLSEGIKDGYPVLALVKDSRLLPRQDIDIPEAVLAAALGDLDHLRSMSDKELRERDQMGNTALHRAAINGHELIVNFLLEKGIKPTVTNHLKQSPAMLAVAACRMDTLRLLADADPKSLQMQDEKNQTILHYAIAAGSLEIVSYLLSQYHEIIDLERPNMYGLSPIDWCLNARDDAIYSMLRGVAREDTVKLADRVPNLEQALHWMATRDAVKIAQDLIKEGADLKGKNARPYLVAAATGGSKQMIDLFLDAGVPVDQRAPNGSTALIAATLANRSEVVRYLIEKGAAVNVESDLGATPLLIAVYEENSEIVGMLLDAGADPDRGSRSAAPLDLALKQENEHIIEMLLLAGAICGVEADNADILLEKALRNDVPTILRTALATCVEPDHMLYGKFPLRWAAEYFEAEACLAEINHHPVDEPQLVLANLVDVKPAPLKVSLPPYPVSLKGTGDFTVKLRMIIDEEGKVRLPEVIESPYPQGRSLLLQYAPDWVFSPAMKGGIPTSATVVLPIQFQEPRVNQLLVHSKALSELPRAIRQSRPEYPLHARRNGINGDVLVEMIIDTEGNVKDAFIAATTHPIFSYSVLRAVETWKYIPGKVDGRPVNSRVRTTIPFRVIREP